MISFFGSPSWKLGKLEDLVFFQRGFDITKAEQKDGEIHVFSSSGPNSRHSIANSKGPGVIIGRKGTLGSVFYSECDYWPHDTTLWSKDLKGNSARFVYYALNCIDMTLFDTGAANPTLNRNHIHKLPVFIPYRDVQDSIAAILSSYDDLIENNRRRIALLEEAARQLYKEWFVRFRFPGHEHVKIVDELPEGWERKSISELSSFLSRGIPPTYDDEADGLIINQKCIRDSKVSLEFTRRQSKMVPEAKLVRKFDVLINSTGAGTLGRVAQNFHEHRNLTVDSHVTIVRMARPVAPVWFGIALTLKQDFIATLGRGATNQTELSKDDVGAIALNVPPDNILRDFEEQVALNAEMVMNLLSQNLQLTKARDLLLPKLMSGAITV